MDFTVYLLLVTLTGPLAVNGMDMHFAGGSMTFKFVNMSGPTYKVRVTSLTAWVLGMGPCGRYCTINDIGKSTTSSRQNLSLLNGDTYFGNWSKEYGSGGEDKIYKIITSDVNNNLETQVVGVNAPMQWEQEVGQVDLDIDPSDGYTDIAMHGSYWRQFNYLDGIMLYPVSYRLQIKMIPTPRQDTGKPNNSPVALFKPVYRILLDQTTTIRFFTFDPDDDIVQCDYAEFVEAGGLGQLNNTVVNKDCSVVINAQESAGFFNRGWGAIPLRMLDYPKTTQGRGKWFSVINIQFMIQTWRIIDDPVFVDPTPETEQEFVVYVGASLKIPLYAKPAEKSPFDIETFYLRSIPPRTFNVHVSTPLTDNTRSSERVKYTIANWTPAKSDVGVYAVGAIVTDGNRQDGLDRNYIMYVKEMELVNVQEPSKNGPYFPFTTMGVSCRLHSTCSFPVYVSTHPASGNITSLNFTSSVFQSTIIEPPEPTTKDGVAMFVCEVTIQASIDGQQRICLEARDSNGGMVQECITVNVTIPDPCKSSPCGGNGVCTSYGKSYLCTCNNIYTGPRCETEINYCDRKPCLNNGQCDPSHAHNHLYTCNCTGTGYTGYNCDIDVVDCPLDACGPHGVCRDLKGRYECDCFSGYSGDKCENVDSKCSSVTCQNGGICLVEGGVGVCKCPIGFSGNYCENNKTLPIDSIGAENPFTIPGLQSGAVLQCFVGEGYSDRCRIVLYSKESSSGSPNISVGLHSPDVTASLSSPTLDPFTGSMKSILTMTSSKVGEHSVCVHSDGSKPDVICYKVNASIHHNTPIDHTLIPTFSIPTLPSQSTIICTRDKPCHVIITTDPDPITRKCTLYSGSTAAIVFKSVKTGLKCETDVLFNPPATGDQEVCLHAGAGFSAGPRRFQGERRCFLLKSLGADYCIPDPCINGSCMLHPRDPTDYQIECVCPLGHFGDRCQNDACSPNPCNRGSCILQPGESPAYECICLHNDTGDNCQFKYPCTEDLCKNGGFCVSYDNTFECQCRAGYGGRYCDPINTTANPDFVDPTLYNGAAIRCEVEEKCTIPVFINSQSAQVIEGPKDRGVEVMIWRLMGTLGANRNEDLLEVTPLTPGDKRVCVEIQENTPHSGQAVCYHIETTTGITAPSNDDFVSPTVPAESTIPCPANKTCRLLMYSKRHQNTCQEVEVVRSDRLNLHMFPNMVEGGSCVTDILISSNVTTGLQDLCLKLGSLTVRCYKVNPMIADPCRNQDCGGGACIVTGRDSYECVCDDKHMGSACNFDIGFVPLG